MMNPQIFTKPYFQEGRRLSMVTCYDSTSAQIMGATDIDGILIGDSVAMVMHGFESTVHATEEMMALHTSAVARKIKNQKLIVADMPFLSTRSADAAVLTAGRLIQSGAHAVKIEGAETQKSAIQAVIEAGIPVMGHLGLTPQAHLQLGGFKLQAKGEAEQQRLLNDLQLLEQLGCFAVVLECIPEDLAQRATQATTLPTIGIGAGKDCNGQILVWQDVLGLNEEFKPRFVRRWLEGASEFKSALNGFHHSVVSCEFPNSKESFK